MSSRLFLEERCRELLTTGPRPSFLPTVDGHALATAEIVKEGLAQLGQTVVKATHITLFVMCK